jgi:hypothetical protein
MTTDINMEGVQTSLQQSLKSTPVQPVATTGGLSSEKKEPLWHRDASHRSSFSRTDHQTQLQESPKLGSRNSPEEAMPRFSGQDRASFSNKSQM